MIYRATGGKVIGHGNIKKELRDNIIYDNDVHNGFLYIPDHKPADHRVMDRHGKHIGVQRPLIANIGVQLDKCAVTEDTAIPLRAIKIMSHNKWVGTEDERKRNPFMTVLGNIVDAHAVPANLKMGWEDCDFDNDHSGWLLESVGVKAQNKAAGLLYLILSNEELTDDLFAGIQGIWLELHMQMNDDTLQGMMVQVLHYITARYIGLNTDLFELRDHKVFYSFLSSLITDEITIATQAPVDNTIDTTIINSD